ncbi:hypothetical protein D3C72_2099540 [compost metagenome]
MAGLIYGMWQKYKSQQIVEFAARAAYQKLFIMGDATTSDAEEIEQLIRQNG